MKESKFYLGVYWYFAFKILFHVSFLPNFRRIFFKVGPMFCFPFFLSFVAAKQGKDFRKKCFHSIAILSAMFHLNQTQCKVRIAVVLVASMTSHRQGRVAGTSLGNHRSIACRKHHSHRSHHTLQPVLDLDGA